MKQKTLVIMGIIEALLICLCLYAVVVETPVNATQADVSNEPLLISIAHSNDSSR